VPEVITDGVNGFIVKSIDEAVGALGRLQDLSREQCRASFEERFTVDRMARNYVTVYERLIAGRARPRVALAVGEAGVADSLPTDLPLEHQGP
jgi:hypothetical protein